MPRITKSSSFDEIWQGRDDREEGIKGNRWHQQVQPYDGTLSPAPVLIGYACDAGAVRNKGRAGAKSGPVTARKMLAGLPALKNATLFDAGDIECSDDALEEAQQCYAAAITDIVNDKNMPLGLGGDHSITYAAFLGLLQSALAAPGKRYGVINIDAHLDNRSSTPRNSGTSFCDLKTLCLNKNIDFAYACIGLSAYANTQALIERAIRDHALLIYDVDCDVAHLSEINAQLEAFIASRDLIYLTIDIDCLSAAVMPAVSAPAAMGIEYRFLEKLATKLISNPKVVIVDIAEFSPVHDIDGHGARVVARLIAALIASRLQNPHM